MVIWQETAVTWQGVKMTLSNELIDSLLADYKTPEDLIGRAGAVKAAYQTLGGTGSRSRNGRAPGPRPARGGTEVILFGLG